MAKEAVAMVSDAKGKAIESALANIEKKFGKGSIMRLGDRPHEEVGSISTNCLSLDSAIGVGGFPRGRNLRKQNLPPIARDDEPRPTALTSS